jgi:hypothetical protein
MTVTYLAISATYSPASSTRPCSWCFSASPGSGWVLGQNILIGYLTNALLSRCAPDISGVSTTTLQIGGAFGLSPPP